MYRQFEIPKMKSLDEFHCHMFFDPNIPPAIKTAPGEKVIIQLQFPQSVLG